MTALSEVPFDAITIGLPVISATGKPGRVVGKTPEGQYGPQGRARFDEVEVEWDHRELHSYTFHIQCEFITLAEAKS